MNHGTAAGAAPDEGAALAVSRCLRCGESKPLTDFAKGRRPGGVHGYCKPCRQAHYQEWVARPGNRERMAANNRANRLRIKIEGLRHYGGVCACCGEADVRLLTFDHIDGGGRKHLAEVHAQGRLSTWLRNNGYPEGFQVLCFNCNSGRSVNGGVCPHQDPEGRVTC